MKSSLSNSVFIFGPLEESIEACSINEQHARRLKQFALNYKINSPFFQMNFEVFDKQSTIRVTILAQRRLGQLPGLYSKLSIWNKQYPDPANSRSN